MLYREIQPTPALARFVECFWTLENDGSTNPARPERLLPDGCVELILNFGERFKEHKADGEEEPQPQHLLVGQMTRPILIAQRERTDRVLYSQASYVAFFQYARLRSA
jgi:hypothetical protein